MTIKLVCETAKADGELIAAVIAEAIDGAGAVTLAQTRNGWRVEAYFAEMPDPSVMQGVLESALGGRETPNFRIEEVPEEDWVTISQQGLPPVRAGRFFIHGSHARNAARGRPFAIEIEAGRAFGTAHHGTTQGCLIAIHELAKKGRFANVLDMGTGSGILAIAAAKSMRLRVLAADIDPVAVVVARDNCRINGVAEQVRAVCASRLSYPAIAARAPFDLIVANILAGPLISLAASFHAALNPRGFVILSGLLDSQEPEVWGRYHSVGFALQKRRSQDGWTTLTLVRR
ncbi:MAG: 50S ribosomal protein L11 methyltransferase [Hyphomicrobiales bacterium]|nr:50S ribosomal protein L11 methyltransferase [Hyphomicrobiales bacterium]